MRTKRANQRLPPADHVVAGNNRTRWKMTVAVTACRALAIAVAVCLASGIARAQDRTPRAEVESSAGASLETVEAFVALFKEAVQERSCLKVAALTQFPLRVNWSRTRTKYLWNRTALCRYFPTIFDDQTIRTIRDQQVADMPAGYRGLMFGAGAIWIQPVTAACTECPTQLRFTAANVREEVR